MNEGGWQNWVRLLCLGVIWGASFMLVGIAVQDHGPLTVAAGRLAVAAMVFMPLALMRTGVPRSPRVWLFALGAAVFSNALPFALLSWAMVHVPSSLAGVFMAALPLVVMPLSHVFVAGETMTLRKTAGLAIGFFGVLLLIGFDALRALGGVGIEVLAQFACLGAAICYAIGSITMKRAPKQDPLAFGALAMVLAASIAVPLALWREGPPVAASWESSAAIFALGLFPTALATMLLLAILERAGPTFLSLVNYQVPVWAMLFGGVFLGEPIPTRLGVALLLILLGVAISQNLLARLRRGA